VNAEVDPHDHPVYQIRVVGRLDGSWSEWFGGMAIASEDEQDGLPVTTMTGAVADQSALLGILFKVGYLNLELLSVVRLEGLRG
jgi:hypothetical protein